MVFTGGWEGGFCKKTILLLLNYCIIRKSVLGRHVINDFSKTLPQFSYTGTIGYVLASIRNLPKTRTGFAQDAWPRNR